MHRQISIKAAFAAIFGLFAFAANAQMPMETFANPSNLQVLPSDITPEALREKMFSFGQQVGLRCSTCHDFDANTPPAERDFASDAKEMKRVAREMILMVDRINDTVASIDRGPGHKALSVNCMTCHRGVSQPRQIDEVFNMAMQDGGLDAAIQEYKDLRKTWYATGAYDFSAWHLGGMAQNLVDNGNIDAGMRVHALNFELNENDGSIYFHRAETYEKQGRIEDAIRDYSMALEMEPESLGFLSEWITRLQSEL